MIHVIQYLCPSRHAIMALPYDPKVVPAEAALSFMKSTVENMVKRKILNPWCGICNSPKLVYEDMPTKFETLDEAAPYFFMEQTKQAITRHIMRERMENNN